VSSKTAFVKTISRQLALDLQTLLLRLGVRSSIYESTYGATERDRIVERTAYQVAVRGTRRFASLVQPHVLTRKRLVKTRARDFSLTVDRESALVEVLVAAGDVSMTDAAAGAGIGRQHFLPVGRRRVRMPVSVLTCALDSMHLPRTARAARVVWQEIESITPAGEERVYDIEVEDTHNFVANNVIVHNCIYQESYLEIAKRIAGFSPGEADDLRKAIGKKIHSLMASLKGKFLEGCAASGTEPAVAQQLWKDMEQSQDYSFNKAHAACYALIAYRTAWLRANHPHEYMAALISSVMNTKDRVPFYVNACHELGIEVLPPDVNASQVDFAVVEGKIRFGLNAVKNVGETACRAIIAAREDGGPFASIWDFTERVDPQVVNKRALESLVKGGALDSTGASRRGMVEVLDQALSWGGSEHDARSRGQGSIFDLVEDTGDDRPRHHAPIPPEEYERSELLRLEKETLGLWVSEHPLAGIADQLRRKTDRPLAEVERCRDGEIVVVGGIVSAVKALTTKKGDPMVFLRLDDLTGSSEAVVFNSVYAAARELCEPDRVLVMKARVDHKEGESKLIAIEVTEFEAYVPPTEVRLKVDARKAPAGALRELGHVVRDYPGEAKVVLALQTSEGPRTLEFGPDYRVAPVQDFYAEVKALLGEAAVL
jgi:DNA polymerase-3 subunit alpha